MPPTDAPVNPPMSSSKSKGAVAAELAKWREEKRTVFSIESEMGGFVIYLFIYADAELRCYCTPGFSSSGVTDS